jgi:hypothetical protein
LHDDVLTGSPGRHDAFTQLTVEHGNEPMDGPAGWLNSQQGCRPPWGRTRKTPPPINRTGTARSTSRETRTRQSTCWRETTGTGAKGTRDSLTGTAGRRAGDEAIREERSSS